MNTVQSANNVDRTATVLWANTWGLNFLVFALLADIIYRTAVRKEASWDLFVLLGLTGVVTFVYAAWHHVIIFNRKSVILMVVGMIVAAVISAALAATKWM